MAKEKLKVGIEAQWLYGNRTGVGNYLKGLLSGLDNVDNKNSYELIYFDFILKRARNFPIKFKSKNFSYVPIKWFPARIFRRMQKYRLVPPLDLMFGKKIYFFSNYTRSALINSKSIIVVYDMVMKKYPEFVAPANLKYLKGYLADSIKKSDHIVTISEASKKAIMEHYPVSEDKISVIYPAVDHNDFSNKAKGSLDAIKLKFGIPEKYILFNSTLEPRKNVDGLLRGYGSLPKKIRDQYALVLVGSRGWLDDNILKEIKRQSSKGKIIVTGYAHDEELPALYAGASLFVYPSFYEGFGMPILEAMASKVPVITSNQYSIPELTGQDGAYLIDPSNDSNITEAIVAVLTDDKLAEKLAKNGYERSKIFSWNKSAKKLVEVFEKVNQL